MITYSYEKYYSMILNYIIRRIPYPAEAEDLTQDVFLKLIEYKQMLREDTIKCFLYTIARNVLTDYLRRYVRKQKMTSYIYDITEKSVTVVEELLLAKELSSLECRKLETFPPQRKRIYYLNRFEHCTAREIAKKLNLSSRTVENHLLIGKREMRNHISRCI